MSERSLLKVIALLLLIQVAMDVVPAPFSQCRSVDTGFEEEGGIFPGPILRTECTPTWWPAGERTNFTWWELPQTDPSPSPTPT